MHIRYNVWQTVNLQVDWVCTLKGWVCTYQFPFKNRRTNGSWSGSTYDQRPGTVAWSRNKV